MSKVGQTEWTNTTGPTRVTNAAKTPQIMTARIAFRMPTKASLSVVADAQNSLEYVNDRL